MNICTRLYIARTSKPEYINMELNELGVRCKTKDRLHVFSQWLMPGDVITQLAMNNRVDQPVGAKVANRIGMQHFAKGLWDTAACSR